MKIRSLPLTHALALAFLAAIAVAASAQTAAPGPATLKVEKLADGVWMAAPDRGANVGWFLESDGVIAIDSGNDAEVAKAVLAKIAETAGKPLKYVVITHAHGDHASGVPVFAAAGARVVCHENAAPAISQLLRSGIAGAGSDPKAVDPGVLAVSERLSFYGGSRRASVYYLGPGHTTGDLIVLLPDDKVMFTGDLAANGRLPYLQSADADPRGWEQILKRLAAIDVDRVVPGHGAAGTRQVVGDSHAYLKKVNELASEFIRTSVPDNLYEMKLREPDNRIPNVIVSPDHIANVRAAVKLELARLERSDKAKADAAATPVPTPVPTKAAPARGKK